MIPMQYHFKTTDTLTGEVRRFTKTGHREAYASLSIRILGMRVECWNELGNRVSIRSLRARLS